MHCEPLKQLKGKAAVNLMFEQTEESIFSGKQEFRNRTEAIKMVLKAVERLRPIMQVRSSVLLISLYEAFLVFQYFLGLFRFLCFAKKKRKMLSSCIPHSNCESLSKFPKTEPVKVGCISLLVHINANDLFLLCFRHHEIEK